MYMLQILVYVYYERNDKMLKNKSILALVARGLVCQG